MNDIIKFNRRQIAKKWAGRIALVGGGYELGRRALRPLFEGLEGGDGGFEGGTKGEDGFDQGLYGQVGRGDRRGLCPYH